MNDRLLTIREACDRLRISRSVFYKLLAENVIPAIRITAGSVRIAEADIEECLHQRKK
jgi:excisionase family DNA binding protein